MISNTLTVPAGAYAPDPDRDGAPMPANIARLLCILRVLLDFGRHLAATIERVAATPGFWLFSGVFGTTQLPVIHAHLRRGILRAAALESLLRQRAATGRDVAISPPLRTRTAPAEDASADPCNEPFDAQAARLTAERAQHDAPVDPGNPATAEQIEAEIRARPIGRTIDDIRRDLGIIAIMCTHEFWDAMTEAVACHQDSATAEYLQDPPPVPDGFEQAQASEPPPQRVDQPANRHQRRRLDERRRPAFRTSTPSLDPFHPRPAGARPRDNVPLPHRHAALPAATGPPPRAAIKRAA